MSGHSVDVLRTVRPGASGGRLIESGTGLIALPPLQFSLVVVGFLALLRIASLTTTGLELYGDEAQYWAWAQHLAFGYCTKPPLIAWAIAATTAVCGDGEACVRLSSPLLHAVTAMVLFALARALGGEKAGFWAAALWITLPAVGFSSLIVSTDVPLLACWALAVLALRRTLDTRNRPGASWAWAATAGIAIGLGLLAKYAMAYAALGAALHFATAPRDRWLVRDRRGLLIVGLATAILAPNVIWNAGHHFATVDHLRANADLGGRLFSLRHLGRFLGEQAGVFGPLPLAVLAWRTIAWVRGEASAAERFLLAFALPPLAAVTVEAFLSRAHANWAVTAYPSAAVLVALWLTAEGRARSWRLWTVGPHLVASVAFLGVVAAWPAMTPPVAEAELARLSGWRDMAGQLRPVLDRNRGVAVVTTDRMVMSTLLYYLRDRLAEGDRDAGDGRTPVWMWDDNHRPENQFELLDAYDASRADPVLLVTDWQDPHSILEKFATAEPVARLTVSEFGRVLRLGVWRLTGARTDHAPTAVTSGSTRG